MLQAHIAPGPLLPTPHGRGATHGPRFEARAGKNENDEGDDPHGTAGEDEMMMMTMMMVMRMIVVMMMVMMMVMIGCFEDIAKQEALWV